MATKTENQVVLITGGSSGIGLGVAKAAIEAGARVVINGRDGERLERAAKSLGAEDRVAWVQGDIGEPGVAERMVKVGVERFGRVDALVNNAGHFDAKPLNDYSLQDFDGYIGFLRGAFLATQAAAKWMGEHGGGSIVNITTNLTTRGVSAIPSSAPIAAKGGVQALTVNLAIELAAKNIRVNAVAPGIVRTPMHDALPDETIADLARLHPLGRIGEISDIVEAVVFLLGSTWITGAVVPVDGGISAGG